MTTPMALTLHQPWATLVALDVKTIETRSWSTDYRGPLLIHAGAKPPTANVPVGEWRTMRWARGAAVSLCRQPSTTPIGEPFLVALPLGAIVASCTLADVVPIMDGDADTDWGDLLPYPRLESTLDPEWLALYRENSGTLDRDDGKEMPEQAPYGDFAPGRFAWLLEDVKATTARCPACWGRPKQPSTRVEGGSLSCVHCNRTQTFNMMRDRGTDCTCKRALIEGCPACLGKGSCDPIPAKGHQRPWRWMP